MLDWTTSLNAYKQHLEFVDRKSKNTIQAYLHDLNAYANYFIKQQLDIEQIQSEQINTYLQLLNDES